VRDEMTATLSIYKWPSQAFWRYFELKALREIEYERPILEIGCGDGQLSAMIFEEIDEAIDINPRAVEKCRRVAGHVYRQVRCLDARELQPSDGGYATIFANCVVEHIPDIQGVLAGCFRGLREGGRLIITVPLEEMNRHLLLPWNWYARLRQRQLVHLNLHSEQGWRLLLERAGFSSIEFRSYLSGRECRLWDTMDSPGCVGTGRYCVATGVGFLARRVLPRPAKQWLLRHLAYWLTARATAGGSKEPGCASVVVARKD
jgi:SAM-dependent methyltransferase